MDDLTKKEKIIPENETTKPEIAPQKDSLPEAAKEVLGGKFEVPKSQEQESQTVEVASRQATATAATTTPIATPALLATEEQQIEEAINLAFAKGLESAIEQIKKSGQSHLLDAFHDKIVDELYQRLVQSGKLKQI